MASPSAIDRPPVIEIADSEESDDGYSSSELPSINDILARRYPKLSTLLTPSASNETAASTPGTSARVIGLGGLDDGGLVVSQRDSLVLPQSAEGGLDTTRPQPDGGDTAQQQPAGGGLNTARPQPYGEGLDITRPQLDGGDITQPTEELLPPTVDAPAPPPPKKGRMKKTDGPAKPRARKPKKTTDPIDGDLGAAQQPEATKKPRQRKPKMAKENQQAATAVDSATQIPPELKSRCFVSSDAAIVNEKKSTESDKPKESAEPRPTIEIDESLGLEAKQCKRGLTPLDTQLPKTVISESGVLSGQADVICLSSDPADPVHKSINTFRVFGEQFVYPPNTPGSISTSSNTPSIALGKRKLLQTAPTNNAETAEEDKAPSKKRAAPKKKPRTLTDLVTEPYRPKEDEAPEPLKVVEEPTPKITTTAPKTTAPKRQRKTAPKKPPKPKKLLPPPPILLAPDAALEQASRQEFIFGTSSQLARENDPDTLRAVQEAIHLSMIEEASHSQHSLSLEILDGSYVDSGVKVTDTRLRLWDISARDDEGSLLHPDIEPMDEEPKNDPFGYIIASKPPPSPTAPAAITLKDIVMSDTDPFESHELIPSSGPPSPIPFIKNYPPIKVSEFINKSDAVNQSQESLESFCIDDSFQEEGGLPTASFVPPASQPRGKWHFSSSPEVEMLDMPPPSQIPPSQSQGLQLTLTLSQLQSSQIPPSQIPQPPPLSQMPQFEEYSDARLAGEVALYGFKVTKRREAMVALLKQCWTSTNTATAFSTSAAVGAKIAKTKSTKKKVKTVEGDSDSETATSKSKFSTKKKTKTIEGDSDPEAMTKPKRGRSKKNAEADADIEKPKRARAKKNTESKGTKSKRARTKKSIESDDEDKNPKRGRPRKTAADSTPEKPKRGRPRSKSSRSRSKSSRSSRSSTDDVLEISIMPDDEPDAYECITRAIKADPPSTDPTQPSWHERILLYDPIVLESLTDWLNSGPLAAAGWSRQVEAGDVKRWSEQRGVLCISEETRVKRSKKKKR